MTCNTCAVRGLGGWEDSLETIDDFNAFDAEVAGGSYNFFVDSAFGKGLFDFGTSLAKSTAAALVTRALTPNKTGGSQTLYAAYGTLPTVAQKAAEQPFTVAGGVIGPAAQGTPGTDSAAAPDYTPWIVAGAGALLLLAVLR